MDISEELNFWFGHHTVMDKGKQNKKLLFCALPDSEDIRTFLTKNPNIQHSSSIPFCAIRFPPKFLDSNIVDINC